MTPHKTCSIVGCGKPFRARGMCTTHYNAWAQRLKNAGQPIPRRDKRSTVCTVSGCRQRVAPGSPTCEAHGGPPAPRAPVVARRGVPLAWRFVEEQIAAREHGAECWEDWHWYPSQERPTLRYLGQQMKAARLVRFLLDGEWPEVACHTCDNERCWNPAHIYAGTAKSNYDDMVARGRAAWQNRG